jgi:thiol-disulfide isomerase/thioredoxin
VAPRQVFAEVLATGTGYGALFGMLLIEFLLSRPLAVASQAMRASFSPGAAISGLLTHYVNFALPTGFVVFVLGIVLYYRLRTHAERRVEIWTAASVLAYAWAPHVLLVALSVIVAGTLGFDHEIMPHHRFVRSSLGPLGLAGKAIIELSPVVVLGWLGVRTVLRREPVADRPALARRLRGVTVAAAVLLLAGFAVAGGRVWSDWRAVRPVMPGDNLPAFTLPGVDNNGFHSAQLHHQVALVDFWATWCPPCVTAMPHLDQFHRDFGGQGFRLVSINGGDDSLDEIRAFAKSKELSFPIYVDTGNLRARLRVDTFPTALLVDRHGTVRHVYIGDTSVNRIRDDIKALLAEPDTH